MPPTSSSPSSSSALSRSAVRRLLKELDAWTTTESATEKGIERLGPAGDGEDLLRWEAVINGRGVGCGYESMSFPFPPPALFLISVLVSIVVFIITVAVHFLFYKRIIFLPSPFPIFLLPE